MKGGKSKKALESPPRFGGNRDLTPLLFYFLMLF